MKKTTLIKIQEDFSNLIHHIEEKGDASDWDDVLNRYQDIQSELFQLNVSQLTAEEGDSMRPILERIHELNEKLVVVSAPSLQGAQAKLQDIRRGLRGHHAYQKNMD